MFLKSDKLFQGQGEDQMIAQVQEIKCFAVALSISLFVHVGCIFMFPYSRRILLIPQDVLSIVDLIFHIVFVGRLVAFCGFIVDTI